MIIDYRMPLVSRWLAKGAGEVSEESIFESQHLPSSTRPWRDPLAKRSRKSHLRSDRYALIETSPAGAIIGRAEPNKRSRASGISFV